jgi:hypothetical protein
VTLDAWLNKEWVSVDLKDVMYIPGAANLFSEAAMDKSGFKIVRENRRTKFFRNGQLGPQALMYEGLYVMMFKPREEEALNASLWHQRLAHINLDFIRKSVQSGAVEGISPSDLKEEKVQCHDCSLGKATKLPFPAQPRRTTQPGEVIHADLSGKLPTRSLGGAEYFMVLKDDKTGFRHASFLKRKSDAAKSVIDFLRLFKNQTGANIKRFKSDGGGEFLGEELQTFFLQEGIIHTVTVPYNPQQNGKIEREMRTIKESARTMLLHSGLPDNLWAEAVGTAVYILNRTLNSYNTERTAYEAVFGAKPNLQNLRIFGCSAYAQIPKEKRGRQVWGPKAIPCQLVGYDILGKTYRLYDPERRTVFRERNVRFAEENAPVPLTRTIASPEEKAAQGTTSTSAPPPTAQPLQFWVPLEATTPARGRADVKPKLVGNPHSPPLWSDQMEEEEEEEDEEGDTTLVVTTAGGSQTITLAEGESKTVEISPMRLRSSKKGPPVNPRANIAAAPLEPTSYHEAMNSPESAQWVKAMEEEMDSLHEKKTWELVARPAGIKVLSSKWVFRIKSNPDGQVDRFKARLVVRGFQQEFGVDFFETFSTVSRYESIRLLLATAQVHSLAIMQFDVKTAFLNGPLEEDVYMAQPQGFSNGNPTEVCHLLRSLYGLKQSPKNWRTRIESFLATCGLLPLNTVRVPRPGPRSHPRS